MSSVPQVAPGATYRFDRFELFPEAGQLRKSGMLVHLAPQPFRILLMLVARAGTLVTREEIQEELWGAETFVDFDQSINAVIRRIRSALNDHVETPRFLQTIPRRGYRFVAPVERVDPIEWRASVEWMRPPEPVVEETFPRAVPDAPAPRPRLVSSRLAILFAWLAPILFATQGPHGAAPIMPAKVLRVAVMPVSVDGAPTEVDPRLLASELRSRLGRIQPERIHVVDRGVADVRVEATLRGVTDGVRVDARLTDVASGRQVWSESFHRAGASEDFPLEVAVRMSRAFVERYVPIPRREIVVRSDVPARALAMYSEARAICAKPAPQRDLDRAMMLLQKAIAAEPEFAEAWSAIGDIWTERAMASMGRPSNKAMVAKARESFARASALAPDCAEVLNNRGLIALRFDHDYAEAERLYRAAIAADPEYNHPRVNLALLLSAMGQHEQAFVELRRAQASDPASFTGTSTQGFLYLMARRYGDATAEYDVVRLEGQRGELAQWGLLSAAIGAAQWDDAAAAVSVLLHDRVEIAPDVPNREAAFRKQLCKLEPYLLEREARNQLDSYVLACFYAQTDNPERAFAALDRAVKSSSLNVMFTFVDPRLDRLRGDPRFGRVLETLKLRR